MQCTSLIYLGFKALLTAEMMYGIKNSNKRMNDTVRGHGEGFVDVTASFLLTTCLEI